MVTVQLQSPLSLYGGFILADVDAVGAVTDT
jgi:hypothetical protein